MLEEKALYLERLIEYLSGRFGFGYVEVSDEELELIIDSLKKKEKEY